MRSLSEELMAWWSLRRVSRFMARAPFEAPPTAWSRKLMPLCSIKLGSPLAALSRIWKRFFWKSAGSMIPA